MRSSLSGDASAIEEVLRDVASRVAAERPGDELIALSTPVEMTMGRCVEVSLVRWLRAGKSEVADQELAAHLDSFWRHMPTLASVPNY